MINEVTAYHDITTRESSPAWKDAVAYLGKKFNPKLANWGDEKVTESFNAFPDSETFYRETDIYIYHGIGYFLSGVKRPYYARLFQLLGQKDAAIIDYGCGAGDDGLLFERMGYRVSFADIPSKAFEFLKWRVKRWDWADTAMPNRIYTIGEDEIPRHHIVWCMDVLEHIKPEKQFEFLDELARLGEVVFVNLVVDPIANDRLHYHVDVEAVIRHVSSRWKGFAEIYYEGRTHLMVYGDGGETFEMVDP
jgi:2-polyprenyl-3-methyl-5-hydroxy-6-metoxy-1,4-benzoquinol methylase